MSLPEARALREAASFGTLPGKSWPETLRAHADKLDSRVSGSGRSDRLKRTIDGAVWGELEEVRIGDLRDKAGGLDSIVDDLVGAIAGAVAEMVDSDELEALHRIQTAVRNRARSPLGARPTVDDLELALAVLERYVGEIQ